MTDTAPLREDMIDAVFRPVIGFFIGAAIGYVILLADVTGWVAALIVAGLIGTVIWLWYLFERMAFYGMGAIFDYLSFGRRVKPQLVAPRTRKKHWFVRYGWAGAMLLGMFAAIYMPDTLAAWI